MPNALFAPPRFTPSLSIPSGWAGVLARVSIAVLGGYAFSAGLVALGSVALPRAIGLSRGEAVLLSSMLGFVAYLVALIWAFAERRLWRVWVGLASGAVASFLLAHSLVR